MKRYYKITEYGDKEWLGAVLIHNGKQIYNPTEEMILSAGYVEHIDGNTPTGEMSEEQILDNVKRGLQKQVEAYDKSKEVELFYIKGIPLWLDREERITLQRRFEIEQKNGITNSTLWKNGVEFPLVIAEAMVMLDALEMYAIQSFDCTQRHIANIGNLTTMEELQSYDYKAGYPEKLRF